MTIKRIIRKMYFALNEHKYQGRLKYLFQKNGSKTLVVIFSGFTDTPVYNYVKTLRGIKLDKLFILDDFAYRGSYYWYSNGSNEPMLLTQSLIYQVVNGGGYDKVITMGSSKGGTAAIYFGLNLGVDEVYAAACQYYIGKYLNTSYHKKIFESMMGFDAGKKEQLILDSVMPDLLKKHNHSRTIVNLFYSPDEHTYNEHIEFLINALNENGINYSETIVHFQNHSDVGIHFSPFIREQLKKYLRHDS